MAPRMLCHRVSTNTDSQRIRASGINRMVKNAIHPQMLVSHMATLKLNAPAEAARTAGELSFFTSQTMSGPRKDSQPAETAIAMSTDRWANIAHKRSFWFMGVFFHAFEAYATENSENRMRPIFRVCIRDAVTPCFVDAWSIGQWVDPQGALVPTTQKGGKAWKMRVNRL